MRYLEISNAFYCYSTYFSDDSESDLLVVYDACHYIRSDEFTKYRKLQKQIDHSDVLVDYLKIQLRSLEKELLHAQEEVYLIFFVLFFIFRFSTLYFLNKRYLIFVNIYQLIYFNFKS